MKRAVIGVVLALGAASCVVGAPPGFSDGNSWSFPLVGPLENGQLVTPVWINDKGPYLFAIDPDSPVSVIDDGIVGETKPYGSMGPRYDDEQDTSHPMKQAEILRIKVGDLTIRTRTVWILPVGTFNLAGRQIRGVLGHDMIADSLVFGFDRDRGMAYLATRKGFTPPPGAASFGFRTQTSHLEINIQPTGRHIATVAVNGKDLLLHVDLGAVPSQLREPKWGDAKLQVLPSKTALVDEAGTARQVDRAGIAAKVAVGEITATGVVKFVAYDDRRWEREDIDGTLGLGFFEEFAVWVDWDQSKIYVVKRAADLGAVTKPRIDRWGSNVLSTCPHAGCVDVSLMGAAPSAEGAPTPTAPGNAPTLHLQRDPTAHDLNLEITLEAVNAAGQSMGLQRMVANLPQGTDALTTQLDPSYADATLRVVDVSPFVRACPSAGGCLYTLGAQ